VARFYKGDDFLKPGQPKSTAEVLELAVAGIDNVRAARALCVAIAQGRLQALLMLPR
jgi:hypothetical protein